MAPSHLLSFVISLLGKLQDDVQDQSLLNALKEKQLALLLILLRVDDLNQLTGSETLTASSVYTDLSSKSDHGLSSRERA